MVTTASTSVEPATVNRDNGSYRMVPVSESRAKVTVANPVVRCSKTDGKCATAVPMATMLMVETVVTAVIPGAMPVSVMLSLRFGRH